MIRDIQINLVTGIQALINATVSTRTIADFLNQIRVCLGMNYCVCQVLICLSELSVRIFFDISCKSSVKSGSVMLPKVPQRAGILLIDCYGDTALTYLTYRRSWK